MPEKNYTLYGTKIFNFKTQEIGLLICLWKINLLMVKLMSWIIRGVGGVTSDRHLTGWVRFAHTAPYRKSAMQLALISKENATI